MLHNNERKETKGHLRSFFVTIPISFPKAIIVKITIMFDEIEKKISYSNDL